MSSTASPAATVTLLWVVVIAEILSPVPLALSLGTIYVLLFRPAWFLDVVSDLYPGAVTGATPGESGRPPA